MVDADKYNFQCEHYDEASQMTREFLLTLYVKPPPSPSELSLCDVQAKRVFLKKGVYDQDGPIRLEDLYVNGTVVICARKFKVISHVDDATRKHFAKNGSLCQVDIDESAFSSAGIVIDAAFGSGLGVKRIRTVATGKSTSLTMEFVGAHAMEAMDGVVKTTGLGGSVQVLPSACSTDQIFQGQQNTAKYDGSILIIRPHAVREGYTGTIFQTLVQEGFQISAVQSYSLTRSQVENFYEVYKTVLPSAHYAAMVAELASGVCIVLEVRGSDDVVGRLRELCGPFDVEIARHLRPGTLRAQLGRDNVHNAVHCTDLPEDGVLDPSTSSASYLKQAFATDDVRKPEDGELTTIAARH
eukprot:CAMPEP_0206495362 /NCGR_PEP_ID=MMETSP0324_2-20121206/48471_1 /ASSEMBLY_ACC=CAM_ASM_000836 /TAXON_ID=2866 /ORGANISM="Crypthecodinium cohnii, Strain Seligo" /LENGTH=354 /DNA_ID=CAMNT_0053979579 /DNA_START=79 /DNA_END=1144 /DNA_ORIENTATION=+